MHADPLEAQMPARSRFISRLSPSKPGKLTFSVFASRASGSPFITEAGKASRIPSQSRSRSADCLARFGVHFAHRDFRRAGHPDDCGDIFRPRAALIFMRSAVLQSLDRNARAEEQNTRAFRPVKLVGRQRERVEISRSKRLLSRMTWIASL